jgi:DNA helicase-2/ATP-dependent DNA helicase PcrA
MKLSKYQEAIYEVLKNDTCNIVVDAKAGSGKTTTIVNAMPLLPAGARVAMIAFNVSIKKELEKKLPKTVDVYTCHGLGFKNIRTGGISPKIDEYKSREMLKRLIPTWSEYTGLNYADIKGELDDLLKITDMARLNLSWDIGQLCVQYNCTHFVGMERRVQDLVKAMTNRQVIDFVDMVYMPAINKYKFEQYDYIFVDECQDISAAQRKLILNNLAPGGRTVWVGDPYQAIYGFAGADFNSFRALTELPNTKVMPLSECYRCGKKVIEYAQTIVPDIVAFEKSGDGQVNHSASIEEVQPGDMVLSRMTAPLVKLIYKFIGERKPAYIKGREIGKSLCQYVKGSLATNMEGLQKYNQRTGAKLLAKMCRTYPHLEIDEVKALSGYVLHEERAEIICVIAEQVEDTSKPLYLAICESIEAIFSDTEGGQRICLSTIHKAKGLEADRVFIVDKHKMPAKWAKTQSDMEQERNLEYVAITRAKEYLGIVTDWKSDEDNSAQSSECLKLNTIFAT